MTLRVSMWSGPRNLSTAMMRAWENRPDTVVVDEPFYAAYLHATGIDHPGSSEVIASQPTDPTEVVRRLLADESAPVHYSKQMTHHVLSETPLDWVTDVRNVLLVRDPREVVASYVRSRESCEPEDIGLLQQVRLLDVLPADTPVIDAGDFLRDPEGHLRWLCDWLGIDFTDRMLHWPAGPRDSDGVWAPPTGTTPSPARPASSPGASATSPSTTTTLRSPRAAVRRMRSCTHVESSSRTGP